MFIRVNRKEIGEIVSTTLNVSEIRYFEPLEVDEGQPPETRVFLKGESPRQFILRCTEDQLCEAIDATRDFRNKTMPDLTKLQLTMKREYNPQMLGRLKPTRSIDEYPLELWESLSLVNDGIFQRPDKYILAHCLFDEKEMDLFFRTDVEITPEGMEKVLPFLNSNIYDYFPPSAPDHYYAIRVLQVAAVDIEHNSGSPYDKRVVVTDLFKPAMGMIWPGMNTVLWTTAGTPEAHPEQDSRHHRSDIMFTAENPADLKRGDLRLVVNAPEGIALYRVENWPPVGRGYALVEYLKAHRESLGLGSGKFALIRVTGKESNGDVSIVEEYAIGKRGRLTEAGFEFEDGVEPRGFGTTEKEEETLSENDIRLNHGVIGSTASVQTGATYLLITSGSTGNLFDQLNWSNPLPQPEHLPALLEELRQLPAVKETGLPVTDVKLVTVVRHYDSHTVLFDNVARVDGVLYRNDPQVMWEQPSRQIINEQRLYPVSPETMTPNCRAVLLCTQPTDNRFTLIAMYRIHEWLTDESITELLAQSAGEQEVVVMQVDWKGKFFGNGPYNFYTHLKNIAGTVDINVVSLHPEVFA